MKFNVLRLFEASGVLAAAIPLMRPGMMAYEQQQLPGNGAVAASEHSLTTKQAVIEPRAERSSQPIHKSDPDITPKQKNDGSIEDKINKLLPFVSLRNVTPPIEIEILINNTIRPLPVIPPRNLTFPGEHSLAIKQAVIEPRAERSSQPIHKSDPDITPKQKNDGSIEDKINKLLPFVSLRNVTPPIEIEILINNTIRPLPVIPPRNLTFPGEHSLAIKQAVIEALAVNDSRPFSKIWGDIGVNPEQKDVHSIAAEIGKLMPFITLRNMTIPIELEILFNKTIRLRAGLGFPPRNSTPEAEDVLRLGPVLLPTNLTDEDLGSGDYHIDVSSSKPQDSAAIRSRGHGPAHVPGPTNDTATWVEDYERELIKDANDYRITRSSGISAQTNGQSGPWNISLPRGHVHGHLSASHYNVSEVDGHDGKVVEKRDLLRDYLRSSSPTSGGKSAELSADDFRNFGHPKHTPQWGGRDPPISDEDFCILSRSMQWLVLKMGPEVEKLVPATPTNWTDLSEVTSWTKADRHQRTQLARVARMFVIWQKLLKTMKLQLNWTPSGLDSVPHCALCYAEYCGEAANLFRILRDHGLRYQWYGYESAVMHNHIWNIGILQWQLARHLHLQDKSILQGEIGEDTSVWAERLRSQHNLETHDSLRLFVRDRDPITNARIVRELQKAWSVRRSVPRSVEEKNALPDDRTADETTDAAKLRKDDGLTVTPRQAAHEHQRRQSKEDLKEERKALERHATTYTMPMMSLRKVWAWLGAIETVLGYPAKSPFRHYGESEKWNQKAPMHDSPQKAANETMRRIAWTVDQQSRMRDVAEELAKDHPDVD